MVTTRGGTETPGAPTPTPVRSSTRRTALKRELESLETPTQAKRQRKTAPASSQKKSAVKEAKEADAPSEEASQESVEVADATAATGFDEVPQTPANDGKLALRRRSSPQVVIARTSPDVSTATESFGEGNEAEIQVPTQSSDFHTPMQAPGSVYATPATTWKPRNDEGSPTPKAAAAVEQTPASSSAKKGRGRPRKTLNEKGSSSQLPLQTPSKYADVDEVPSSSYQSGAAPILSQEWVPQSAQPEKAHTRFGSEEPAEAQDSPIANRQGSLRYEASQTSPAEPEADSAEAANHDDDAIDSDDEAPEVVTTAAASSKAQAAQAEADRAQKAQQAKDEARRQAREELIAAQQAAKREREEKKAKKVARKAAKEQKFSPSEDPERESHMPIDVNGLLPTSLLENIEDQRPPTPPPTRRGKTEEELRKEKLNHHIKFLERTEKGPKDVKKGKLSVAVLAQQSRVLPPKVNRQIKNVREHWLKGRQQERKVGGKGKGRGGKMERRAYGNRGFLRNGEE
jgi:U3 small nucleolar RNA-associated protein 16